MNLWGAGDIMGSIIGQNPRLFRAEMISLILVAITTLCAALFIKIYHHNIDLFSFTPSYLAFSLLIGVAIYYRRSGRSGQIADTLLACAIFISFTTSGAILNYSLLGRGAPIIDEYLFSVDQWLGFSWERFLYAMAQYPRLSGLLAFIYNSSFPQIILVFLTLGFLGKRERLHHFLLVGILCSIACICIWAFFPSFGPSAYVQI